MSLQLVRSTSVRSLHGCALFSLGVFFCFSVSSEGRSGSNIYRRCALDRCNFFGMIALLFNFLKIVWKIYCDVVLRKDELLIIDGDEKDENVA